MQAGKVLVSSCFYCLCCRDPGQSGEHATWNKESSQKVSFLTENAEWRQWRGAQQTPARPPCAERSGKNCVAGDRCPAVCHSDQICTGKVHWINCCPLSIGSAPDRGGGQIPVAPAQETRPPGDHSATATRPAPCQGQGGIKTHSNTSI